MTIVEPKVELWTYSDPTNHIARCARVCYASDKTSNSIDLCRNLIKRRHISMFRHVGAYYKIPEHIQIPKEAYIDAKEILIYHTRYISTNEQAAMEYWDRSYSKYKLTQDEAEQDIVFKEHKLLRYTICVETGIDITRELNRKSPNNIAEQSTRYVDFNKKIGIRFKQCHWMRDLNIFQKLLMKSMCKVSEWFYKLSRSKYGLNLPPQDARWILPLDIMSKAVYTYTIADWEYILNLRLYDYTGPAHKDAKIVAYGIKTALQEIGYDLKSYKFEQND